ncbi:MAG: endonuclease/exonuclease/phosphatase family protein [Patescibacteria group bacterium]
MEISLIQLNIEKNKHLERILLFLSKQIPDVVCLQELRESDISVITKLLGGYYFFIPRHLNVENSISIAEGIGIFSKFPIKKSNVEYYRGGEENLFIFDRASPETKRKTQNYPIIICDIEKEGILFRIATTHFTWTPDGESDDFQRQDLKKMLEILNNYGDLVLCGDFNAPRGGEIFGIIAKKFTDNVPPKYTTSIDGKFHRAGYLERMVDGIFSTCNYKVSEVEMINGLSDHCALVAKIIRS